MFATASSAMTTAQTTASSDVGSDGLLDFSGPCTLGGSVALTGTYAEDAENNVQSFDLMATFTACREAQGTLDGALHWTSVNVQTDSETSSTVTMAGDLHWDGPGGAMSCEIDTTATIDSSGFTQSGTICGHDVSGSSQW